VTLHLFLAPDGQHWIGSWPELDQGTALTLHPLAHGWPSIWREAAPWLLSILAAYVESRERGDCPHRERVEMWARGLGLDVPQAVAAWRGRYEVGLIAEVRSVRSDVIAWRQGRAGRVRGVFIHTPRPGVRISCVSVWRDGEGYAGQIGGRLPVKAPTLAGVLAALAPVSA
jgi:hypothetical protein